MPLTASGRLDGRSARKIETRRKIILAAAELCAESGYSGTSMDDIAEAAGVSKGTIFYNFTNKAELFEQLIGHAVNVITADIEEARQGRHGWEALITAMDRVIRVTDENPSYAQILLTELFRSQRPWASSLRESRRRLAAPLAQIIEEIAEERLARAGSRVVSVADVEAVAMSLVGGIVVATLDHKAFEPDVPLSNVHDRLVLSIQGMNPAIAPALTHTLGFNPSA